VAQGKISVESELESKSLSIPSDEGFG